jgi:hypothetical protein
MQVGLLHCSSAYQGMLCVLPMSLWLPSGLLGFAQRHVGLIATLAALILWVAFHVPREIALIIVCPLCSAASSDLGSKLFWRIHVPAHSWLAQPVGHA